MSNIDKCKIMFTIYLTIGSCHLYACVDVDFMNYIEYQCIENRFYMENSDSFEWHQYFRGKFDAYQDVIDYINSRSSQKSTYD